MKTTHNLGLRNYKDFSKKYTPMATAKKDLEAMKARAQARAKEAEPVLRELAELVSSWPLVGGSL